MHEKLYEKLLSLELFLMNRDFYKTRNREKYLNITRDTLHGCAIYVCVRSLPVADIEMANRHGHTCLMIACYRGHIKIAKFLLALKADANRKSVKGNTALHDCAESGSLEILKVLVEHGAQMDVDSYGMTPLLAAAVTG